MITFTGTDHTHHVYRRSRGNRSRNRKETEEISVKKTPFWFQFIDNFSMSPREREREKGFDRSARVCVLETVRSSLPDIERR